LHDGNGASCWRWQNRANRARAKTPRSPAPCPGALDKAAAALGLAIRKDAEGHQAEALKTLRMRAHTRRVCRDNGWPTGEEEGFKIDSGDYVEPEYPEETKATLRKAWLKLTHEEQELLAAWRRNNRLDIPNAAPEDEPPIAEESGEPHKPDSEPEPEQEPRHNGHDNRDYSHGEQRKGRRITTYLYRDHRGNPHTRIEKWRSSTAARAQYPQSFWVEGHWVSKKPEGWLKVPYRLPELLAALSADVFCPEGEKDCDSLAALGLVTTTNSEGATPLKAKTGKWTPELNKWFHGVRRLFILADNDEVGRRFAEEKARALGSIVPDLRVILFPDVPNGEDVSWWLAHGHTKEELIARCEAAPRWNEAELESVRADQVAMEVHDWLWRDRFAIGEIGLLVGMPDEGKGQCLANIAACVTRELEWPNGEGRAPQGNVILLTAEDDIKKTVVPRLKAAGADLNRIEILSMVKEVAKDGKQTKRMFSLLSDLERLRRKIQTIGNVRLIEVDPVSAYLGIGKMDSYRTSDVRAVMGPLKDLAEELAVSIIGIMHFNKKADVTNVLLRVSDSLAFVAAPRHVFGIIDDAENGRKLFVSAKNNLVDAEQKKKSLAFRFDAKQVGTDKRNDKAIIAPFIVWEPDYVDVTAAEALSAVNENKSPTARDSAKQFLHDLLVNGPVAAKDIEEAAKANGISRSTLFRAKRDLNVIAQKDRSTPEGVWMWRLP
jgi:putative DNA primase/helicase